MRTIGLLTIIALVVFGAVAANAAPVTVSFIPSVTGVDAAWVLGTSYASRTLLGGAVTVTARVGGTAEDVRYAITGSGGSPNDPLGLTVDSGSDTGNDLNRINYYATPETVRFAVASPAWRIIGFELGAFSYSDGGANRESAQYSVNGAAWVYFQAANGNGGIQSIAVPGSPTLTTNFEIQAAAPAANFAIRSITFEQVGQTIPEPATFLLLGGGLVALGLARKRFRD